MARLEFEGLDELSEAFGRLAEVPDSVKTETLDAMADVAARAIRRRGESMGVRDPESDVHILDRITTTKAKLSATGGSEDITFSGTRSRGGKRVRNAEIAFINEYGKRNQPARPFIGRAMNESEAAIADAGGKVLGDWMDETYNK